MNFRKIFSTSRWLYPKTPCGSAIFDSQKILVTYAFVLLTKIGRKEKSQAENFPLTGHGTSWKLNFLFLSFWKTLFDKIKEQEFLHIISYLHYIWIRRHELSNYTKKTALERESVICIDGISMIEFHTGYFHQWRIRLRWT